MRIQVQIQAIGASTRESSTLFPQKMSTQSKLFIVSVSLGVEDNRKMEENEKNNERGAGTEIRFRDHDLIFPGPGRHSALYSTGLCRPLVILSTK